MTRPGASPTVAATAAVAAIDRSPDADAPPPSLTPAQQAARQTILRLGVWESGLSSAGRVLGGSLLGTGVALSLGGAPLLLSALGLAPLTSRLGQGVGASLLRRYGTARVLTVTGAWERLALLAALVGALLLPMPWAAAAFAAGMIGMFFAMGITEVGLSQLVAEVVEDGTHGRYQGARHRALALSGLVVSLTLGLVIDVLEVRHGWPSLQVRLSLMGLGVLVGGTAWWRVRQILRLQSQIGRRGGDRPLGQTAEHATPPETAVPRWRRMVEAVRRTPPHILGPVSLFGFGFGLTLRNGDAALLGPMGYTLGQAMWLASLTTLMGMLLAGWWGRLGDRIGAAALVPVGMAGVAASALFTLLGLLHHPRWAWAASMAFGFGLTGYNLLLSVWLLGQSRPHAPVSAARRRTGVRWLATYHATFGVTASLGTLLGGVVRQTAEHAISPMGGFVALFLLAIVTRSLGVWLAVRAVQRHHPRQWRRLRHVVRQTVHRRLRDWTRETAERPPLPGTRGP